MVKARMLLALGILVAACQPASVAVSGVQSRGPSLASAPAPAPQGSPSDWLNYHNDLTHQGVGPTTPAVDTLQPAWTAPLDGEVYGEPLVSGNLVIAVTENDTVY